jgi:selenocysteine lyase/cysteine desulfurase
MPIDVTRLRADFPLLARTVHDRPLIYLDNASTTQKPACVLERWRVSTARPTPTCTAASTR